MVLAAELCLPGTFSFNKLWGWMVSKWYPPRNYITPSIKLHFQTFSFSPSSMKSYPGVWTNNSSLLSSILMQFPPVIFWWMRKCTKEIYLFCRYSEIFFISSSYKRFVKVIDRLFRSNKYYYNSSYSDNDGCWSVSIILSSSTDMSLALIPLFQQFFSLMVNISVFFLISLYTLVQP